MQINRLLEIVYVLLSQKTVTAKELSARFSVSQRTVYRDIDALSLAGIPVYTEKGKNGGISLLPEFVLSKSILSEQEQNEILSALHGLSGMKTPETNGVLQKLSSIFNKSAANWLEVDFTDWGYHNGGTFNDFKTAILERRIAEFDYYSTQVAWASSQDASPSSSRRERPGSQSERPAYGEKTHRRIEPLQLWFKSKSWYIKGFCLIRQDIRLFKLTRVKNLSVSNEKFNERDLLAILPNDGTPDRRKPDVMLKLKIAPEMTYRVYDEFEEDSAEKLPDGSFVVSVTWPEDDWVYGTILSYGEYIEVLEPEHIREIIKNKMLKGVKKYL